MDWKKGEMNYSAIADITVEELEQFRDLYEIYEMQAFQETAGVALRVSVLNTQR
jgi:hypothetical protein